MCFSIPETKGIPLEEMAELFGDNEEVIVHLRDIHMDEVTHEIIATSTAEESTSPPSTDKVKAQNVEFSREV